MSQNDGEDPREARHALLQEMELEESFDRARCEQSLAQINGMEWPDSELDRLLQNLMSQAAGCQPATSDDRDPLFDELLATVRGIMLRQLARTDLDEDERACVIEVVDTYIDLTDDWVTAMPELVAGLMTHATFLRDHMPTGHEELLAKALPAVGRIAEDGVVPDITDFLRPCDAPDIKLAAFVALHTLFSGDPPAQDHPRLWERLRELLDAYMREELVRMSDEICQLAISAFIVAGASGTPGLVDYASRIGLLWPTDQERLTQALRETCDYWRTCRNPDDPALVNLTGLLESLA